MLVAVMQLFNGDKSETVNVYAGTCREKAIQKIEHAQKKAPLFSSQSFHIEHWKKGELTWNEKITLPTPAYIPR